MFHVKHWMSCPSEAKHFMSPRSPKRRVFAIVPAAGQSRRMGRAKLLLPIAGRPVLEHVLSALTSAPVAATVVVMRPEDGALHEIARRCGAEAVIPAIAPQEMIVSIQHALRFLAKMHAPSADDAWLLALADQPTLSPAVIEQLVIRWQTTSQSILVPVHDGKRGHPVLFGWSRVTEALALDEGEGLNRLVRKAADTVEEVPVETSDIHVDLNTPEEYERLRALRE
jgi:molybdenum cofactor cytidylyltransferase